MKIGLYGLPTSGKSYILDRIDFMDVKRGSETLKKIAPDFKQLSEDHQNAIRKQLASSLSVQSDFIMDGHYSFGEKVVFTEDDGKLYDAIVYLYVDPVVLQNRMKISEKNADYIKYDMAAWQSFEIEELRNYCHLHNKDFYVVDNPPENEFQPNQVSCVLDFIYDIVHGFSCVNAAKTWTKEILTRCKAEQLRLLDGDKTVTTTDTSNFFFGYKTHIFDGNFYTGYQSWRQSQEFQRFITSDFNIADLQFNRKVLSEVRMPAYILTTGCSEIWSRLSEELQIPCFYGREMCADAKYFVTKFLQESGKRVVAYGDSMNDYFMLLQANKGYLVRKYDGTISRSLNNRSVKGLNYV